LKSRKNIALKYSLLLWAALLCLSGYIRADQIREFAKSSFIGNPLKQLSAEEQPHAVAWSEQLASYASVSSNDCPLPVLVPAFSLSICSSSQFTRKHKKVSAGFSSICGQFRILPNAP
jgi:hypothetical protein